MKEIVVISGKGGTGKTSMTACFAAFAQPGLVLADADVDASDLPLLLQPETRSEEPFRAGVRVRVRSDDCMGCGRCRKACRFEAIRLDGPANDLIGKTYRIDPILCEGCAACTLVCPTKAIDVTEKVCGACFTSSTRFGTLVHARLFAGEENSGKLVTRVRRTARDIARQEGARLLIVDGSPGIGCPVIASITDSDAVVVVVEPTVSGVHDMERVIRLTEHFYVPVCVCVNKADLNRQVAADIEAWAEAHGCTFLGGVRYDAAVTRAQIQGRAVVEVEADGIAEDIRAVWARLKDTLAL